MTPDEERDALVAEIAMRLEGLVTEVQVELARLRQAVRTLKKKWFHTEAQRERETADVLRRADMIQAEVVERALQLQVELDALKRVIAEGDAE